MTVENTSLVLWFRRLKIVTGVALLQICTQFINALTGFMLVRLLDKNEYALFTIFGSMLALMSALSDSGVHTGLLSVGGQVYKDRFLLGQLVATAIRIQLTMAGFAMLIVGPLSWYLLARNNASSVVATVLTLTVLASAIPSAFSAILVVAMRLVGHYHAAQMADVIGATCRLFGSAIAVLITPAATLCTFAVLLAQGPRCLVVYRSARKVVDLSAEPSIRDRRALMSAVRALWFPRTFDAFQSQFAIWLLSVLGTSSQVADLGALGRLAALFSVVNIVITVPISSAFARCQHRPQLLKLLFQSAAAVGALCGMLTLLAFVFPTPFVWVLGSSYSHFSSEIGLYFIASSIGSFTFLLWEFARSKMWVTYIWTIPPATVVVQCLMLLFLDVRTVPGVLTFMIGSSLVTATIAGLMALKGICNMKMSGTTK